jgi:DNA repair protein RadC
MDDEHDRYLEEVASDDGMPAAGEPRAGPVPRASRPTHMNAPAETHPIRLSRRSPPRGSAAYRILNQDPRDLALHELVSLILEPGLGADRAYQCAVRLLAGLGRDDGRGPLRRIGRASPCEIVSVGGITPAAAARLLAALEIGARFASEPVAGRIRVTTPRQVFKRFHKRMRDLDQVEYWVLVLSHRHEVMQEQRVAKGTATHAIIHPREVLGPAIRENAQAVVLVHNDPTAHEKATPRRSDKMLTARLRDAAAAVGIEFWDHVIVGEHGYLSFRQSGILFGDTSPARTRRAKPRRHPRRAA